MIVALIMEQQYLHKKSCTYKIMVIIFLEENFYCNNSLHSIYSYKKKSGHYIMGIT